MHVDEEQLQRLVDDELAEPVEEWVHEHLTHCGPCRDRVERARHEQDEVLALVETLDHPRPRIDHTPLMARRRRAGTGWMRKAAGFVVVAALAGAAYAAPGSRLPGLIRRTLGLEQIVSISQVAPLTPPGQPVSGLTVTAGNRLTIIFVSPQASGEIRVSLGDGNEVEVRANGSGASYSSGEELLTVDNAGSTASYEVVIPRRLPLLEIRVGDRRVFFKDGDRVVSDRSAGGSGAYVISLLSED